MHVTRGFLHVDDDPLITKIVGKFLAPYGYEGIAIHDPLEVVEQLPRFRNRVILLDTDMPGMTGLELLEQIKAFDAGIPVIMLSGLATMDTVLQSQRLGAEACLFKPMREIEPLADAMDASFRKIERWRAAADEFARRWKMEPASYCASGPQGTRDCV